MGPAPTFLGPEQVAESGVLTVKGQGMEGGPGLLPPVPEPLIGCQETWEQLRAVP